MKWIIIIILGLVVLKMLDTLSNLTLKAYKNPLGKKALMGYTMSIFVVTILFLTSYFFSFFSGGNFSGAMMVNLVSEMIGFQFHASPMLNLILDLWYQFPFLILAFALGKIPQPVSEKREIRVSSIYFTIFEQGESLKIDKKMALILFRFNAFLAIFTQFLLFRFVAYPTELPKWFDVLLMLLGAFLVLYGIVNLLALKVIVTETMIQSIFDDINSQEVEEIFEQYLKEGKVLVDINQLTKAVDEFIQMEIFETSRVIKESLFPNDPQIKITIQQGYLDTYLKYRRRSQRHFSSNPKFKKYKR